MKKITIDIEYNKIKETTVDKNRNFIIDFKNGDRFFFAKKDSDKIKKHLLKNFNGDHL